MLFSLDPSVSVLPGGFLDSSSKLSNSQQNSFSVWSIFKICLQKAYELSFGVNGSQYKKKLVSEILSPVYFTQLLMRQAGNGLFSPFCYQFCDFVIDH